MSLLRFTVLCNVMNYFSEKVLLQVTNNHIEYFWKFLMNYTCLL